jgi:hypothetical protein
LINVFCFSQENKNIFFTHTGYIVDKDNNPIREIKGDVKITIDYKLLIISVLSNSTEDLYSFYNVVYLDKGTKDEKMIFELHSKVFDTMMLWLTESGWNIMFSKENKSGEPIFFYGCKIVK